MVNVKKTNSGEDNELIPTEVKNFFNRKKGSIEIEAYMATLGFRPVKSKQRVTLSLVGENPITYETIPKHSKATGIPIVTLYRCKNKANVEHPVTFNRNGNAYTVSFEGFKDKVKPPSDRPKRLGKPITFSINGGKPITYESINKASKAIGISPQLLRYLYYYKSHGMESLSFNSNGNYYCIYSN